MAVYRGFTDKQLAFIDRYVANGGNATLAAKEAGYSHPEVECARLAALPHVRAEIRTRVEIAIEMRGAQLAWGLIEKVLTDDTWPKHLRLDAAKFTLKAGGYEKKEAALGVDKPLDEMTVDELADFVAKGEVALAALKPAMVTEIQTSPLPTLEPA